MYLLMFGTIFKNFPELITYLVSKTWVLLSLKISSKFFFGNVVYVVKWTSCLWITGWLTGFGKWAQFEWSGLFNSTGACDTKSFPHNSLIIWTKESHVCFSICQSTIVFTFINSHFLNICCFGTWLRVMTTTLTGTLSSLEAFATTTVVMVGLTRNMFWTFIFLGQLGAWYSKLK